MSLADALEESDQKKDLSNGEVVNKVLDNQELDEVVQTTAQEIIRQDFDNIWSSISLIKRKLASSIATLPQEDRRLVERALSVIEEKAKEGHQHTDALLSGIHQSLVEHKPIPIRVKGDSLLAKKHHAELMELDEIH